MLCNSTKEFPVKSVISQFVNHAKFKAKIPEVSSNLTILYGEGYHYENLIGVCLKVRIMDA